MISNHIVTSTAEKGQQLCVGGGGRGKNGAAVRALASHQCGPATSNPGVDAICGLSLLLVLSLAPSRGFSPGTSVFRSPQKSTFPNSNSTRNQLNEEPLCGCATSKSLFIYYLFLCSILVGDLIFLSLFSKLETC